MPNDTLDEIEARWRDGEDDPAYEDVRTLIEMVRARDRALRQIGEATVINVALFNKLVAALDTPPAQEQPDAPQS